jgi:hypothetical protein
MRRLRTHVIYDPGEPVVVSDYVLEAMAVVDQAVLEAAAIPSMIRCDRAGEITQRARLIVRREHLDEARAILSAPAAGEQESDALPDD